MVWMQGSTGSTIGSGCSFHSSHRISRHSNTGPSRQMRFHSNCRGGADFLDAGEAGAHAAAHVPVHGQPGLPTARDGAVADRFQHGIGAAGEEFGRARRMSQPFVQRAVTSPLTPSEPSSVAARTSQPRAVKSSTHRCRRRFVRRRTRFPGGRRFWRSDRAPPSRIRRDQYGTASGEQGGYPFPSGRSGSPCRPP
jgi:hypothetical protein